jgi:two-component system, cell cycle sensor histidine kinase and response regulator CckA
MKKSPKIRNSRLSADTKKISPITAQQKKNGLPVGPTASQEIIDAEAKYQVLFESANDSIILMDRDLIVDCNQNTADMFRCRREDIIGKNTFNFWPEYQPDGRTSREVGLEKVKLALLGDKRPFELRHRCADGTFKDTYVTLNVFTWQGKKYLQAIIRDYTEIKQAHDRLEAINKCWLSFGANPLNNINNLVALCGRELKADCAFYNRIDHNKLFTIASYNAPVDLQLEDAAEGHICTDVVSQSIADILIVRDLPNSKYAKTDPNVIAYGLKTYIGKPVSFEKKNIGTICVVYKDNIEPQENHLKLLGIIAAAIGIEETRRHVIAELYDSEERFRLLVANSPDLVFALDENKKFTTINENISKKYGYNLADVIGHGFNEFVHNDDRDMVGKCFQAMLQAKKELTESLYFRLMDKKRDKCWNFELNVNFQYDEKGNYQRAFGIARDITERKRTEEALHLTQLSVDNAADAFIWVMSDARIANANKQACRSLGYSREELLSMKLMDIDPHLGAESWLEEWQQLKTTGKRNFETVNRRKDGSTFPVEVSWNFIDVQGKELSFAFIHDISERRRLERQLLQAQKMEAIGTLAGGIAHDFNNLLMGIQGNASLMQLTIPSSDPNHEKLLSIQQLVQNSSELTHRLLGFARGGKYNAKPADIIELVRNSAELFGRTKKEISLHQNYQNVACIAEVDRVQIEQVLLNIFVNAWQAMPSGGNIFISVSRTLLDIDSARSFNIKDGHYIKISIQDTGIGMDKTTMSRIFEPFFTTKEMGHGVGLGLASVYGIIRNHKGVIEVESEIGHGTSFNIYLPASDKKIVEEKEIEEDIIKGSETLLLVDDEQAIIEVTQDILKMLGYNVLTAKDGQEAINIYRHHKDEIALVIMDMIMPQMGGSECFDRLKEINPSIKVILSSGYSMTDQAQSIMQKGCCDFIQKPFGIKKLSRKIRESLDKDC